MGCAPEVDVDIPRGILNPGKPERRLVLPDGAGDAQQPRGIRLLERVPQDPDPGLQGPGVASENLGDVDMASSGGILDDFDEGMVLAAPFVQEGFEADLEGGGLAFQGVQDFDAMAALAVEGDGGLRRHGHQAPAAVRARQARFQP